MAEKTKVLAAQERAATMFQDAWRVYSAREILRGKAKRVYMKEFNPEHFKYTWVDQRNGTIYLNRIRLEP